MVMWSTAYTAAVSTFHHRRSWEWALGALAGILLTKGAAPPAILLCLWVIIRSLITGYGPLLWMLSFLLWSSLRYPVSEIDHDGSLLLQPATCKGRPCTVQKAVIYSSSHLRRPTLALIKLKKPMAAGTYCYALTKKSNQTQLHLSSPLGYSSWRTHWKHWWHDTLSKAMGGSSATELYAAMATGSASQGSLQKLLQRWGMVHLLAVSGLHVNLLAALLGYILRLLGFSGRPLLQGQLIGICGYLAALGPYPSALRAGLMSVAQLAGRLSGRQITADYALGIACIALLLWAPEWSSHMGFQLSCCATAGLLAITKPCERILYWLGCPSWLRGSLSTQLAATMATAPILIATFHSFNVMGLLVNMVAAPLLCWGFAISLMIPLLGEYLGRLPGMPLAWATELLLRAIELPQSLDQWTPPLYLSTDCCALLMLTLAVTCIELTAPSNLFSKVNELLARLTTYASHRSKRQLKRNEI